MKKKDEVLSNCVIIIVWRSSNFDSTEIIFYLRCEPKLRRFFSTFFTKIPL